MAYIEPTSHTFQVGTCTTHHMVITFLISIQIINLSLNHLEYYQILNNPEHGIKCRHHVPDMVLHWLAH
ncbi:hypothetical protein F383_30256 [Gossypium arboreum]|uniref:Uncharacterized protein n=1 Tax=Gossypium arboreum TaxID=29729 RepID=A0A0B0PKF5_GOSAR|nr:hypothetical protein F383_30256 [Gossypium arboreum]